MTAIPPTHADILEKKAFAHFATLMPDGSPQCSVVWIDYRDGNILVNSAVGRRKDKNVRADPRVAISVADPDNPYRQLMIRGRVTGITTEGGDDHIDFLAKKYLDADSYPFRRRGETRVIYTIEADAVSLMG